MTHADIAETLRLRRRALALTQDEAAARAGVHRHTWQRWEQTGRGDCATILAALEALGVRVTMRLARGPAVACPVDAAS